jgi:O-antigen/teichoic acid export membrane protein
MIPRRDLGGLARRGIRWTAVSAVGSATLQLLQIAVLARLLDPADFGRMAMLLVILSIGSTFSEFGLSSAIIQRPDVRRSELATLYSINLLMGISIAAVLWILAPWINVLIGMGEMTALIRGTAVLFLVVPWGAQFQALFQKKVAFATLACANLVALLGGTVVAIIFARAGFGVWALLAGYLVTQTMRTAIVVSIGVRQGLWSGFNWNPTSVGKYLSFGGLRLAAMLANSINARIDQLVIGSLMGAAPLGVYNVAHRLVLDPVQRINPKVTRVAFPVFSLAQTEPERLQRGFLRMNRLLLSVNAPLLFGLAVTAHLVVPMFLGPNWADAVLLVRILVLYALFRSIGNAAGSLIVAKGRVDWGFYWNVGLLLVVPATVWLAAHLTASAAGVASALVALYALVLAAHYFLLLQRLIGKCGFAYLVSIAKPTVAAGLMAGFVSLCDVVVAGFQPFLRLAILLLSGVLAYIVFSLLIHRELLSEVFHVVAKDAVPTGAAAE